MSRTRTLSQMLLDVRQRTNQENSTFVTDAELTEYLNQELAELWTRLVLNQGQPHFRSTASIPVVSGTATYALATYAPTLWSVQEVTALINGSTMALLPFMASERAGLVTASPAWPVYAPVKYRIQGANIEFLPSNQTFTATVYYSPCQPRLVASLDTFDGFNGYEVAAIYGVCATVAAKEESDPGFFLGQKAAVYRNIDAASAHRDMSSPERVQDVLTLDIGWPGGWVG